jgi:hypothetical protein
MGPLLIDWVEIRLTERLNLGARLFIFEGEKG